MAHISHRLGPFDGQIGPVVFTHGEAETDDADTLAYFMSDPDTFDVTTDTDPEQGPEHVDEQSDHADFTDDLED